MRKSRSETGEKYPGRVPRGHRPQSGLGGGGRFPAAPGKVSRARSPGGGRGAGPCPVRGCRSSGKMHVHVYEKRLPPIFRVSVPRSSIFGRRPSSGWQGFVWVGPTCRLWPIPYHLISYLGVGLKGGLRILWPRWLSFAISVGSRSPSTWRWGAPCILQRAGSCPLTPSAVEKSPRGTTASCQALNELAARRSVALPPVSSQSGRTLLFYRVPQRCVSPSGTLILGRLRPQIMETPSSWKTRSRLHATPMG
jgi:hypothetical protein